MADKSKQALLDSLERFLIDKGFRERLRPAERDLLRQVILAFRDPPPEPQHAELTAVEVHASVR